MKQAEQECEKTGISVATLMENAGTQAAAEVRNILGEAFKKNIVVLVGPGNNGGDGLVAPATWINGKLNLPFPARAKG
jgi:NAD(P)H-hydrate epimerase